MKTLRGVGRYRITFEGEDVIGIEVWPDEWDRGEAADIASYYVIKN